MSLDHEKNIRKALKHGDANMAASAIESAFADDKAGEEVLAWAAGVAYENQLTPVLGVLPEFLSRFPNSMHMIRVYYADLCAAQEHYDTATTHARLYIRMAKEAKVLGKLSVNELIQEAVGRAFLLATSAYTELGARSYSRRLLEFALTHDVHASWHEAYRGESERLSGELSEPEAKAADERWERFYKGGMGASELANECDKKGYPDMALRVELIGAKFAFDSSWRPGTEELLMAVGKDEKGAAVLT